MIIGRSTKWRKCVEEIRDTNGGVPPAHLVKISLGHDDPAIWLESLGNAANAGDEESWRSLVWIGSAIGVPLVDDVAELEWSILRSDWWRRVHNEFVNGDIRASDRGEEWSTAA